MLMSAIDGGRSHSISLAFGNLFAFLSCHLYRLLPIVEFEEEHRRWPYGIIGTSNGLSFYPYYMEPPKAFWRANEPRWPLLKRVRLSRLVDLCASSQAQQEEGYLMGILVSPL